MDFSIARSLGYYTGIVYETVLDKLPQIGSICSGGRYDNLTKSFSDDEITDDTFTLKNMITGDQNVYSFKKINFNFRFFKKE